MTRGDPCDPPLAPTASLADIYGRAQQLGFLLAWVRRPGLVHDETIFICGDRLCRSGVPGLSAGCQGFCRYDRHREHELHSLAVYERASFGGYRLDLRFLDWTQLRCCGEWSITGENQYVGDSGRSRKNMRSANIANISQRRMDHVSRV
jgi:hypothetical protein